MMKNNVKRIMASALMFAMVFSFSKAVGPSYYKALDNAYDSGKNVGNSLNIDWSKYF